MTELTASRTLVKSPPELWAECSDAASLSRHLDHFGEIRITRLEPETAVAWEGEHASGTVRLEPSGWGTRVVLTAQPSGADAAVEEAEEVTGPEGPSASAEVAADEPATTPRRGPLARLLGWLRGERPERAGRLEAVTEAPVDPPAVVESEADPAGLAPDPGLPADSAERPPTAPAPEPRSDDAAAALEDALESLGQAHHRPYSRA